MAELTADDVETFTGGRLLASDQTTIDMLNAALVTARRYVGWHVSPVVSNQTVVLDGPDSRILMLPTRKLNTLTSITENGTSLTLSTLSWSAGGPPGWLESPVRVRKNSGGWWTGKYRGISVVMSHGYTEAEAADWRRAVLLMVDRMSLVTVSGTGGMDESMLIRKTVDDVTYGWASPFAQAAEDAMYSFESIFCDYSLPRVEFV
jgi:hypothetical protein